jgi:hypothetical protein
MTRNKVSVSLNLEPLAQLSAEEPKTKTFPLHIEGRMWKLFTDRAYRDRRSAHAILLEFIAAYGRS